MNNSVFHLRLQKTKNNINKDKLTVKNKPWENEKVVIAMVLIMKQLHKLEENKKLENCNSKIKCKINLNLSNMFWALMSTLNKCKTYEL